MTTPTLESTSPAALLADGIPAQSGILGRLLISDRARAVLVILAWKLGVLGTVAFAYDGLRFFEEQRNLDFYYPRTAEISFSTVFTTWDSSRYLFLAEQGYAPDQSSNWFAPLFPLSIRGVNLITGDSIVSGLLISNVASTLGLYLFYVFARERLGESSAFRALLLLVAFPTAFFLNLIYTEGLFLLFTMLFLYFLYQRRFGFAALAAFPLPMIRLVGVAIALPFAVFLVVDSLAAARRDAVRVNLAWLRHASRRFVYILGPLLGLVAYYAYMFWTTGDALAAQHAQGAFISGWDLKYALQPWVAVDRFFGPHTAIHGDTNSGLDRMLFVGFLASTPLVYRRLDKPLFALYLVMGLQPLLGSYMSYMRYIMLALPLYLAYGSWLGTRKRDALQVIVILMAVAQFGFLSLHVTNHWVS